jgi:UDP-glucuronate 4-epimerase
MRVAVTGAAGFIGSHLCERLLGCGHSVVGVDNFDDFYAPARKRGNVLPLLGDDAFTLGVVDVRDRAGLERQISGVDAVIHLAARAGVRPSFARPDLYTESNVAATVALLQAIADLEIPRLVFISSSTVYGEGAASPFREDGELGVPKSPYAATKVAGELLCQAFAHRIPKTTILRLFSVYGSRQRPDLAIHKFARCIYAGEPIPVLGTTDSFRDYTYVDDVVTGISASLELERPWTVLNLGSGSPVTLEDMIRHLEDSLGQRVGRRHLPPHPGDLFGTWADTRAAARVLDWAPRWTFERGVRRFTDWFMEDETNRLAERAAA